MRPNKDNAIYRPDLGALVMEYEQGPQSGFIGHEVLPIFPVNSQSGTYPVIPREALLKLPDTNRAPRGKYNRDDFEYERGTFTTSEHGFEEPVDDTERGLLEDESNPGAADALATERAWDKIMRGAEKRIADMIFNDTTFTAHSITHEWDDADNAVPIDDVNTGAESIRQACGMLPNTLIIAYSTFTDLKNCDQIVDRLKYTFPGIDLNRMTSQQLAAVFNIPKVLVGGAVYDSSGKGIATSIGNIWSNEYAMLTITAEGRDLRRPCLGHTFLWSADSPSNPVVESYREEQTRSDIFRVRHNTDEALMASKNSSGTVVSNIGTAVSYLFDNVTT